LFWTIYAYQKDLIWPKAIEKIVPEWQNHVMHSLPLVAGLVETFISKHEYNKSFFKGCAVPQVFGLFYLIW
jgi:hypothetical protein